MRRTAPWSSRVFVAALPLLLGAQAGGDAVLEIRFIGNAAFAISDGATTLVTDFPYSSGAFGYMTYPPGSARLPDDAVVVITHNHADHFDPRLFLHANWRMIGAPEITDGLPDERVVRWADAMTVGAFRIEPIPTPHSPGHHSYLITWKGLRLYHSGDTDDPSHLFALPDLDLAIVTPWLYETVTAGGLDFPARTVLFQHQRADEVTPTCDGCTALDQGELLRLGTGG